MMQSRLADSSELTIVAPRRDVRTHLREIASYSELTRNLIRKELKVRYKQSTLGLAWSMIQPLFLLLIYSLAFSVLSPNGIPRLGIWIMSGLLVWTLVSTSLSTAVLSITANGPLVGKVRFPRAVLPTATTGAALVHFGLQMGAFAVVLLVVRQDVDWEYVPLIPVAIAVLLIFLLAIGLLVSAANVYARDMQHLLEMLILGWFWVTPIVYPYGFLETYLAKHDWPTWLPMLNPITPVITVVQRALYGATDIGGAHLLPDQPMWWYLRNLGLLALFSVGLLYVALRLFDRAEVNMAESL
jgi:ABC-2 type transport system permease protein